MRNIYFILFVAIFSAISNAQISETDQSKNASIERLNQPLAKIDKSNMLISDKAIDLNEIGVKKALQGNYAEAVSDFRQASEIAPNCLQCRYNLAMSLTKTGESESAREILEKVVVEKSDYGLAFAGLGEVFYNTEKFQESVAAYRKAVKLLPQDAIIISNLGTALQQAKQFDEALEIFDQSLKIAPNIALTHNNRGVTLFHLGRMKDAVKSFRLALTLDSTKAQTHNNLGVALDRLGKYDEGRKSYLEALRLRPNWNYAVFNLAMNRLDSGDREGARTQLAALEKIDTTLAVNLRNQLWQKFVVNVTAFK